MKIKGKIIGLDKKFYITEAVVKDGYIDEDSVIIKDIEGNVLSIRDEFLMKTVVTDLEIELEILQEQGRVA